MPVRWPNYAAAAFVDDGDLADNIFNVSVGYSSDGPFTTVLTDIPSNKDRSETLQQFRMDNLARYIKIEASDLGSGSLHISEVRQSIVRDCIGSKHDIQNTPQSICLPSSDILRRVCGVERKPPEPEAR